MNPKLNEAESDILEQLLPLQNKHIFTNSFGDGQIELITRKNDLSGAWVYFDSNEHGTVKLDGKEFLNEITHIQEII